MNIGIAGVGLVGRVLALNLLQQGHTLTLFDEDTAYGDKAAGMTAAGMLAVFAELESAESVIFDHGNRSISARSSRAHPLPCSTGRSIRSRFQMG